MPTSPVLPSPLTKQLCVAASYMFAATALLVVLLHGLLLILLCGLLTFSLIQSASPLLGKRVHGHNAKLIAVGLMAVVIILVLVGGSWVAAHFFQSEAGSLHALLQKLADIIAASSSQLPVWLSGHLPQSVDELNRVIVDGLREHAEEAKAFGTHLAHSMLHAILGMVIGAMVALVDIVPQERQNMRPLAAALLDRIGKFAEIFKRVVFAQAKISAINAAITAVYVFVVLPLAGVSLPFSMTIVLVTFFGGLLPVVGNLISNSILVVVSLSQSLHLAFVSLGFMVVIHKLEYFLNAKIIGSFIHAKAWELLVSLMVMEALFGLPGIVASPIVYAYIKRELSDQGLV